MVASIHTAVDVLLQFENAPVVCPNPLENAVAIKQTVVVLAVDKNLHFPRA